ncbi:MAG: hypothetical protein JO147_08520 [Actinobacteria bacterium]|nr:hypothetical protein [Actinomycetota bacterium]
MTVDQRDHVGLKYLGRLSDADLRTLVHAESVSPDQTADRIAVLRRSPGLVLDILDRPDTSAALLRLVSGPGPRQFTLISPFLLFAAAIHRTAVDLSSRSYAPERAIGRLRVPLFDAAILSGYLDDAANRLFLIELLSGFARTSAGVTLAATPTGLRRRRWNSLDAVSLARLLVDTDPAHRPEVWRRLADLALFMAGVFPDAAHAAFHRVDLTRLARAGGLQSARVDDLESFGPAWYRLAAVHDPSELPDTADRFHQARRVLNAATDRYLFPVTAEWFAPPG